MNNDRRKAIRALAAEVTALNAILSDAIGKAEDLHSQLEALKDEEQEYYDNMPEGLQNSDKGSVAQEAIDNLENALSALESLKDFDNELENAADAMESACG